MAVLLPDGKIRIKKQTIPANSTISVDNLLRSKFISIKLFMTFWNLVEEKTKKLELDVINKDNVDWAVTSKVGLGLGVELLPSYTATNFILDIKNNESFDIELEYAEIILGRM